MVSSEKQKLNRKGDRRGMHRHPNSIKNLQHNGRPHKEQSILDYIRAQLTEQCQYEPGKTWLEALAHAELRHSLNDTGARRDLLDRLLGRPIETFEAALKGGIVLRVIYDDSNKGIQNPTS